jgi:L-tartrate/succinate antiporter
MVCRRRGARIERLLRDDDRRGLTVVDFVVHYMFASLTAHTTALLPVLLTAVIAVHEMPVKLISLLFCDTLGLMGIISPCATGPGPAAAM